MPIGGMGNSQFRGAFIQVGVFTVTADFPSATAGVSTAVTGLSAPGAAIGDVVLVSPVTASTAGFAFSGQVTAANTVSVTATNGTAGTVDLASASYLVVVLRPKTA